MNVSENNDSHTWTLWTFVLASGVLTVFTMAAAMYKIEGRRGPGEDRPLRRAAIQSGEHDTLWSGFGLLSSAVPFRIVRVTVKKPLEVAIV